MSTVSTSCTTCGRNARLSSEVRHVDDGLRGKTVPFGQCDDEGIGSQTLAAQTLAEVYWASHDGDIEFASLQLFELDLRIPARNRESPP